MNEEIARTDIKELFLKSLQTADNAEKMNLRRQITERDTESPFGLFCLAWLMARNEPRDYKKIISLYSDALNLDKDFWLANFERGNMYFDSGDFPAAVRDYETAIGKGIEVADIYYNAGLAQERAGDAKAALEYYEKTTFLEPKYPEAYYAKAAVFISWKNYDKAVEMLNKAIELQPDNYEYHLSRGLACANLKEYGSALKDLAEAIRLSPDNPAPYSYRGNIHLLLKESDKAFSDFLKVAELDARNWSAFQFLGIMLCSRDMFAEGRWCIEKSLSLHPDNPRLKEILREEDLSRQPAKEPDWKKLRRA